MAKLRKGKGDIHLYCKTELLNIFEQAFINGHNPIGKQPQPSNDNHLG